MYENVVWQVEATPWKKGEVAQGHRGRTPKKMGTARGLEGAAQGAMLRRSATPPTTPPWSPWRGTSGWPAFEHDCIGLAQLERHESRSARCAQRAPPRSVSAGTRHTSGEARGANETIGERDGDSARDGDENLLTDSPRRGTTSRLKRHAISSRRAPSRPSSGMAICFLTTMWLPVPGIRVVYAALPRFNPNTRGWSLCTRRRKVTWLRTAR